MSIKVKCGCKKVGLAIKCHKCGGLFCEKHIYTRVDGNNIAITRGAPPYCEKCYVEVYGSTK